MNGKTTLLIIILIVLGIAGGYYLGTNYKFTLQPQNAVTTTAPVPTATPQPQADQPVAGTPSAAVVSPTADETAVLISAVRAGLVAEHGSDAANLNVTVSKIQGNFAQGGASGQGGGGMWFAAKVAGIWKLAWDGNGTISCASINPYNFPATIIPECFDEATQKLVTR